ncbi:MAG: hypothetical protein QW474_00525 [Candidatus Aenigmatarchaeota archaeon]
MADILIYDNGLALEIARILGKKHNVKYYIEDISLKISDAAAGFGFDEITKIEEISYSHFNQSDYIFFFDSFGFLVDLLSRLFPSKIIGTPSSIEIFEFDRVRFKKLLKSYNLKYPKTYVFKGVDTLLNFLKKEENKWKDFYIKINKYRGSFETFKVKNYIEAQNYLLQTDIIALKDNIKLIVEEPVSGIEFGIDTFFDGSNFIRPLHLGIEIKGEGMIGRWLDKIPPLEIHLEKLRNFFKLTNFKGFVSIEGIWDGTDYFFTDLCARAPFPISHIMGKNIINFDEVLINLAEGYKVELQLQGRYNIQVEFRLLDDKLYTPVFYPMEIENFLSFMCAIKSNNIVYLLPNSGALSLCYWSNNIDDCFENAEKMLPLIEGDNLYYHENILQKLQERINLIRKAGFTF